MSNDKKKNAILGQRTGFSKTSDDALIVQTDKVAESLNQLHQSILTSGKNMIKFAIEAGELLVKKKGELKHGEFTPWIEENLSFKVRTAQRYVKIYEMRETVNASALTHLEDAYKLVAGNFPAEKELNPIEKPTLNFKEVYTKFKSGNRLPAKEKTFLKEYLMIEKEKVLAKANKRISQIEEDLNSL
ncbi:DUF3102 domain-containing protein [Leptospira stimsonii]|uniref:DUF3102 domain-containing protein n=1 Tax=Leptospira stimsonii TaxID=2202203 RepID=A0ABY2N181_9LEPT|nr:DUF3102 domain-containing protein [Leptospira stimsonii]TGK12817.1 DUF3102 domain-containing protein [Leptospira stimsonii]TGM14203.1 DUF3102 domain-containing protein [Leptospira stimsonii]